MTKTNLVLLITITVLWSTAIGLILRGAVKDKPELQKVATGGFVIIDKAMPSETVKFLSRSSESITLTGLESILNMDNDDYVVMRTSFEEGNHTILFSPDKTMRIIPAFIDDAEIKSIIKGYRTKNYP